MGINFEIQELVGFEAVAKYLNFSDAGTATHRTQPAVTLQVKSLEEKLGARLFDRVRGKVLITREGEILLELLSPLLLGLKDLNRNFDERRGSLEGHALRIATHSSVPQYFLPKPLIEFRKAYPKVEVSIVTRAREEIIRMVKDAEVDVGITSPLLGELPPGIEYRSFLRTRRVIIAPKECSLTKGRAAKLSNLAELPFILPPRGSGSREAVDAAFKKEGIPYKLSLEVNGREACKTYVKSGFGISVMSECYLTEKDKLSFKVLDGSSHFGFGERGTMTLRSRALSKPGKAFIEMLSKLAV